MFPFLLATGFSFEASNVSVQNGLVATFLILYTFAYSWGAGVVPFLYSSEVFPQVLRGKLDTILESYSYDVFPGPHFQDAENLVL